MGRERHRPRRGNPGNPIVSGDSGTYAGPQGGARQAVYESGDLEAREYGVPQADVPGGKTHVVNPETIPERPPGVPERGADQHKYHGVEPLDDGFYETPSPHVARAPRPEPVPDSKFSQAVPVYIVEDADAPHVIRGANVEKITVVASATANEPTRICGLDPRREEVMLLADDGTHDVLFADTQATLIEGRGALLSHSATSYTRVATQDFLYAWSGSSTAAATLSVIIVTERAYQTGAL